jgi:tetratricopeptide (TPR) repeat protein
MSSGRRFGFCPNAGCSAARLLAIGFLSLQVSVVAFPTDAPPVPNRGLARSYLANAQKAFAAGDSATAREKLQLALRTDSKYADAYLMLGLVDFKGGETASAIQHYKKALALQPSYSGHYNLALAYLKQHRVQDGRAQLERAVKLDPHQPDAAYDLGVVLLELGNASAALPHLVRARTLNPQRPDVAFNIVRAELEAGRISEARGEAQSAAKEMVSDFQWNAAVGQLFLRNAQPRDAVTYFRQANLIRPADPEIRRQLAGAYLASGEPKQVLDLIQEAQTDEDHYLRGSAYYLDRQYADADRESAQALALAPENPHALVLRVRLLQRAGQQDAALELAKKATSLSPAWDEPYYLAGVSLFYIRHYSEASQNLARAVELNPKSARALFLEGIALASQEKVAEAEQSIRRAIALQPNNARFHCHLGILLMRKNDYAAAEESFRKAVELAPGYGLSHYELGKILARSNRLKAAAEELNQAVARDPSLGSAYYQLSRVYARLGDNENSQRVLAEFQRLYREQTNESEELADDARKETESSEVPSTPTCDSRCQP